jgi:hypothetical protein
LLELKLTNLFTKKSQQTSPLYQKLNSSKKLPDLLLKLLSGRKLLMRTVPRNQRLLTLLMPPKLSTLHTLPSIRLKPPMAKF